MIEGLWATAAYPELPKTSVAQRMPEGGQTLGKDLFPVRDEEQSVARQVLPEARVMNSRHNGLTGTRGRNKEVAMKALAAGELDLLEKSFLKRLLSPVP